MTLKLNRSQSASVKAAQARIVRLAQAAAETKDTVMLKAALDVLADEVRATRNLAIDLEIAALNARAESLLEHAA